MSKFRGREAMLEITIIGQEEQAFAVMVQTPDRINMFYVNIVAQCWASAGELGHHAIWFVEKNVAERQAVSA
jgi:hypothetical protein